MKMEDELNQILSNEELDNTAKTEAIQKLVGASYVPVKKHTDTITKLKNDYSAIETEYNNFKEAKMTDEEKQAEAIKVEREKSDRQSKMLSQLFAENTFSKAGFGEEDYKDIIPNIIQDDPETTKKLAEQICSSMVHQRETIENRIKEQIKNGQKKPEGGNDENQSDSTDLEKLQKAYDEAMKKHDMVKVASYTRQIAELRAKNK